MASATCMPPVFISIETKKQGYVELEYPLVSELINHFPSSIPKWSYRHVSGFIVKLLCLPKPLEIDIRSFIVSREINGAKLLALNELELQKLGFNQKWCSSLSLAIQDLRDIVTLKKPVQESVEELSLIIETSLSPLTDKNTTISRLASKFISLESPTSSIKLKTYERNIYKKVLEVDFDLQSELVDLQKKIVEDPDASLPINKALSEQCKNSNFSGISKTANFRSFDYVKIATHTLTVSIILAALSILGYKALSRK